MKRNNFTLIELLVVVAIIGILMGIILPAITGSRREGQRTKAKAVIMQIAQACSAYRAEYGTNVINAEVSMNFNAGTWDHLRGEDNAGNATNWRRIKFFKSDGTLVNPWGKPYLIMFDANYNGSIHPAFEINPIGADVLIWTTDDTGKRITSWK